MAGNMYAGVKPINDMGGRCKHECVYCSSILLRHQYPASREKYNGEYRIYEHELKKNYKNKVLFVCGQNDLFEASVPEEIIVRILERCRKRDQSNLFMFQTKNPERINDFHKLLPENHMIGTTIETNREEYISKYSNASSIKDRMEAMILLNFFGHPIYITIEPILDFDLEEFVEIIKRIKPDKVYIGADSKVHKYPKIYNNLKLPEPNGEKVLKLIEELEKFTEVEIKKNLIRILKGSGKDEEGNSN